MQLIALASLVVKTDHTLPGDNIYQSVLVAVPGGCNRYGHMPDDHLDQRVVIGDIAEPADQLRFHRHKLDRRAGRCQQCQQQGGAPETLAVPDQPGTRTGIGSCAAGQTDATAWQHGRLARQCGVELRGARVDLAVSRGWQPCGRPVVETGTRVLDLLALDGEPALDHLRRNLPPHEQSADRMPLGSLCAVLLDDRGCDSGGKWEPAGIDGRLQAVAIVAANADGSLTLAQHPLPGSRVASACSEPPSPERHPGSARLVAFQRAVKEKTPRALDALVNAASKRNWRELPEALGPLALGSAECMSAIATPGITREATHCTHQKNRDRQLPQHPVADLVPDARRNVRFSDADSFGLDITTPISITLTLGDLDDSMRTLEICGALLRG